MLKNTLGAAWTNEDRLLKQHMPSCPICGTSSDVVLYGQQRYILKDESTPSIIYGCRQCDFNFRRFNRSFSEVFSHFEVAAYSREDVEQKWRQRREGFYRFLLDQLSKPADGKLLLDIGCAFGHFLDCAVEYGYKPFGVEVSEEMAELLRKRKDYHVSSRVLNDLQLPEKRFDVITFVDSFYYFENPLETLCLCHKLLKPGGELLMRVTNRNELARLYHLALVLTFQRGKLKEMPFWTTDDAISCHSRRSLTKLMAKTGFQILKLTCFEKGKEIESFGLRAFYKMTNTIAHITRERICLTPGIICLAVRE